MKMNHPIWNWIKLIARGVLISGVFIGLFTYAMFQGGFVSWFLFYSSSILVILMLLYAAVPLGSFHVTREMGEGANLAGSELTINVVIRRKWPFPFLYLYVNDQIDERLIKQMASNQSKMIFYPTMRRELTFSYVIPEIKRGEYYLYGIHLETSDMFGLFNKQKLVPLEETILIYPNYHQIERWSAYEKNEAETKLSSYDFIEDLTSVAGAREYVAGDKMTSIDWKVTARSSKLMTKEFEEYIGENLLVVFNNHIPNSYSKTMEAYEKGIELVTSIVMYANRKRLKIGMWVLGAGSMSFPLDRGTDHQKRLITHLAKIKSDEKGNFTSRLKELEDKIPEGATLIFVSTELTDEMLDRVRLFRSRRINVYFCLMDRGSETDPWEERRFAELRRLGAETYILSGGNIDHAMPAMVGE